ncbi:MAG: hypothetical protein AB8G99_20370 [Planctomycetaceae bacterium]
MNQLRDGNVTSFCCQSRRVFEFRTLRDLDTSHVAVHGCPFVAQMLNLIRLKVYAIVELFIAIHNWLQASHRYLQPLRVASISARLKCGVDLAVDGVTQIDAASLPRNVVENVLTKC